MLGHDLDRDFADLLQGNASSETRRRLAAATICTDGHDPTPYPVRALSSPTSSLYERSNSATAALLVVETLIRQQLARRSLVHRPFSKAIGGIGRAKHNFRQSPQEVFEPIVAALIGAERIMQRADDCLAVGIAMSRMLARRKLAHRFVIGVTLPFAAHCWIQAGDVVLTDTVERVSGFTPILVL